jgi:hypothetical protein
MLYNVLSAAICSNISDPCIPVPQIPQSASVNAVSQTFKCTLSLRLHLLEVANNVVQEDQISLNVSTLKQSRSLTCLGKQNLRKPLITTVKPFPSPCLQLLAAPVSLLKQYTARSEMTELQTSIDPIRPTYHLYTLIPIYSTSETASSPSLNSSNLTSIETSKISTSKKV